MSCRYPFCPMNAWPTLGFLNFLRIFYYLFFPSYFALCLLFLLLFLPCHCQIFHLKSPIFRHQTVIVPKNNLKGQFYCIFITKKRPKISSSPIALKAAFAIKTTIFLKTYINVSISFLFFLYLFRVEILQLVQNFVQINQEVTEKSFLGEYN